MLPRSNAFDAEVRYSHKMIAKAELWVDGKYEFDFIIEDGNVRQADKEIRRRCDIQVLDPDFTLTPDDLLDELSPAGNEFKVYRGIRLRSGVEEYLPQGVFTIDDVRVDSSGDGHKLRVEGFDRARRVQRSKSTEPISISSGTNVGQAIKDIVSIAYPNVLFDFDVVTDETNNIFIGEGRDLWKKARSMATSIGYEVYFDEFGVCVLRPVSTSVDEADWEYDTEVDDNLLLYMNRRLHNNDAYNHVVVTGENSDNDEPFRGEAFDDNPLSPTYIYGKFGDVPIFETSSLVTSDAQATTMAEAILSKGLGVTEEVNIITVVHPAHTISDVVRVHLPRANTDSLYVIDSVTLPLVSSRGLNVGCRERIVNT